MESLAHRLDGSWHNLIGSEHPYKHSLMLKSIVLLGTEENKQSRCVHFESLHPKQVYRYQGFHLRHYSAIKHKLGNEL